MKIKIGYPHRVFEKILISEDKHIENLKILKPVLNTDQLRSLQQEIAAVTVSDKLLSYVLEILENSRQNNSYQGLSPRAGRDIIKASKSWAFIEGRNYVLPDDVQAVLASVISHRLSLFQSQSFEEDQELTKSLIKFTHVD
jgi:MoxR-like ATPase